MESHGTILEMVRVPNQIPIDTESSKRRTYNKMDHFNSNPLLHKQSKQQQIAKTAAKRPNINITTGIAATFFSQKKIYIAAMIRNKETLDS